MQNNINVGSENASKITDIHGGSGVVGKIVVDAVVPVFAVLVVPNRTAFDLVKMLAVNNSPYYPVGRLASGAGISLELLVAGSTTDQPVELFGYSGTGSHGSRMNDAMIDGFIEAMSEGTDFVNHVVDDDLSLQLVLNEVLRHHYTGSNIARYLETGTSQDLLEALRKAGSDIIAQYDAYVAGGLEKRWDVSKLMVISDQGCVHIDQLPSVGAMSLAWIESTHSGNGEHVPFRRNLDGRPIPLYLLDYVGCKTHFDVTLPADPDTGMHPSDLRRIRNEVLIQNFWYFTRTALERQATDRAAELDGECIGSVFILEHHLETLVGLPFLSDSLPRGNHRITGVCVTHPNGHIEYHQIRRKGVYSERSFAIVTPTNLADLLTACPSISMANMVANGFEFGHTTVSAFTF